MYTGNYNYNACDYTVPYISLLAVAIAYSQSNCSSCAKPINAQKNIDEKFDSIIKFQDIIDFNLSICTLPVGAGM